MEDAEDSSFWSQCDEYLAHHDEQPFVATGEHEQVTDCPCKALWRAVLGQAIRDALGLREDLKAPAVDWLRSKAEHVGSLEWICYGLDLDGDCIRQMVDGRKDRI